MELGVTTRTLMMDYTYDALYEELRPILKDEIYVSEISDDATMFHFMLYLKRKDGTTYVQAKRFPTNRKDCVGTKISDCLTIKGTGEAENTLLLSIAAQLLSVCQKEDREFCDKLDELLRVDNNLTKGPFGDFENVKANLGELLAPYASQLPEADVCYEDIDFIYHSWCTAETIQQGMYQRAHWKEQGWLRKPNPVFPNMYGVVISRDGKAIIIDNRKKSLFQKISNFLNKKVA